MEIVAVSVLAGLLLIRFLPSPTSASLAPESAFTCREGNSPVITTLGYNGTYLLDMVDGSKANVLKGEVRKNALLQGMPNDAWWWFPAPPETVRSLLVAYPARVLGAPDHDVWDIYSEEHLASYFGQKVGLCVSDTDTITVFGAPHHKLNSITAL